VSRDQYSYCRGSYCTTEPLKTNYGRGKPVTSELTVLVSKPKSAGVRPGQFHSEIHSSYLIMERSKRIFEILGFTEAQDGLRAPTTDISSSQGRLNRRRLLRAWVELGSWIFDFKRAHGGFAHSCHRNSP
jgi:hypothetical protein